MLQELRHELAALITWEEGEFLCPTLTEIDAISHRIVRMTEIMRRMREIAERN